mmetsp:Transcript_30454/g.69730  ORF Transcript_30454/g.69730 Transcript_30454/m.69730 type:complete len:233 (-) Transcript_30454:310-1008(-)
MAYKEHFGDCNVPFRFPINMSLGKWVKEQRVACKLRDEGKDSPITDEQYHELERLNFPFDTKAPKPPNIVKTPSGDDVDDANDALEGFPSIPGREKKVKKANPSSTKAGKKAQKSGNSSSKTSTLSAISVKKGKVVTSQKEKILNPTTEIKEKETALFDKTYASSSGEEEKGKENAQDKTIASISGAEKKGTKNNKTSTASSRTVKKRIRSKGAVVSSPKIPKLEMGLSVSL